MSLRIAARLARRELRGGLRGFRIFLGCVIMGVAAIAAVGTLRESVRAGLATQGAELLGGDAELEFTYRFARPDERDWMEGIATRVSGIADFRSRAVTGDGARELTQVKAVDSAYPLIGEVGLAPDMSLDTALAGRDGLPGAVMEPVLATRLGIAPGETFRLGEQQFRLMAEITREPDPSRAGFGLGPRSIVSRDALAGSGLLSEGSLFSSKYRLDLPPDADLAALEQEAERALEGSGMRWSDARNASPRITEFVTRLGAFLILVGLSGLAVGGVGISAALRAYLASKVQVIATLRTLGADQGTVFLTYFLQVGALALLGILGGLILGVGLPVALGPVIAERLPVPAVFAPYPGPMIEATLYSVLSVLIFTLWPLARAREVRAAALYRDAGIGGVRWPGWPWVLLTIALFATLVLAAALFSGNAMLTLWTAGGIVGALALLWLAAAAITRAARALRPRLTRSPMLGWALGAIGGPGNTAGPVMLALGLGLSVLAAVGQIDGNLRRAIAADLPERAPSFFFVDLQKDQMEWFLDRLENDPGVARVDHAPMLRGIIARINDRPAREVAPGHWVVEGDRAVSYAESRPAAAQLRRRGGGGNGHRSGRRDHRQHPRARHHRPHHLAQRGGFLQRRHGLRHADEPIRPAGRAAQLHRHGLCRQRSDRRGGPARRDRPSPQRHRHQRARRAAAGDGPAGKPRLGHVLGGVGDASDRVPRAHRRGCGGCPRAQPRGRDPQGAGGHARAHPRRSGAALAHSRGGGGARRARRGDRRWLGGQPLRDGNALHGGLALGAGHRRGRHGDHPAGRARLRPWPAARPPCKGAARPRIAPARSEEHTSE